MREAAARLLEDGVRVGAILAEEDLSAFAGLPVIVQAVGSECALEEVAQRLFASLRTLDEAGVSVILARDFWTAGLGLAIRDRLTRASGGRVIEVD
jgi:L-threonylcarbamoyladenylate synthase